MLALVARNKSTTDENIKALKKMILDNRQITVREIADDVGVSFGLCQAIFTDILGMKRAAATIVSKLPNNVAWTKAQSSQLKQPEENYVKFGQI